MALKFKDYSFQNNSLKYILLIVSLAAIVFFRWLAVPIIFVLYLIVSTVSKEPEPVVAKTDKEITDVTV